MSNTHTIEAEKREESGTGAARALRREGKVPGIVYGGGGEDVRVALNRKELTKQVSAGGFFSRLLELKVGNENIKVLPRDIQFHPISDAITHMDFLRIEGSDNVRVFVPVKFINQERSAGIKRGGVLNVVRRQIELLCPPNAIPEFLEVDVLKLVIGDSVHISAITLPEGVVPVIQDRDFTVATLAGSRGMKEEETTVVAAAEGEGAEGAEKKDEASAEEKK